MRTIGSREGCFVDYQITILTMRVEKWNRSDPNWICHSIDLLDFDKREKEREWGNFFRRNVHPLKVIYFLLLIPPLLLPLSFSFFLLDTALVFIAASWLCENVDGESNDFDIFPACAMLLPSSHFHFLSLSLSYFHFTFVNIEIDIKTSFWYCFNSSLSPSYISDLKISL